jgi:hypothetical protein
VIRIEIQRDRDRQPGEGIPRVWSMLALMTPWEREALEPPERPVPVARDPFAIPPREWT